ncbi:phosphoadenosine phosphosulfate reductase domain-containing protein [Methanoplanus endosymbiosus]|uniref:Phosphoadenosine phosphosulfate reductase family protein n=1 Tax=Methanoplanus endosymbiosus TaxID=33865 RepID=A0A9E7PPV2_9EURY|nr:phosphoadenosine phosphosulfate reductase family protein [Methanoplanus endosymbiosus]UUX91402.1 phosphoadenosine phosphosulfate reductase family protein [Methanoplanus endosymbiosus]
MYKYEWDPETGGYLLTTTSESIVGKELRPVYSSELDLLGFNKYWTYPRDDTKPLLWAENNLYYYLGRIVGKTSGGSLYNRPTLIIIEDGLELTFVDVALMVNKNRVIMDALVHDTLLTIYATYQQFKNNIDIFYVAFSGGKDSIVALDLVHRTLPKNEFLVLFGDTDMELPDTYLFMNVISKFYNDISFHVARAEITSVESWNIFGPPARGIRWCCSVHKTAPQIRYLRNLFKKSNVRGMAFTGIRAEESNARFLYDMVSVSKKHPGQASCHPILQWNSAELFLYIYGNNLPLNEAYKKGNSRVGCLLCPMSGGKHEFIKMSCYPDVMTKYIDIIRNTSSKTFDRLSDMDHFIEDGGWKIRCSGREIKTGKNLIDVISNKKELRIISKCPADDWSEWIKALGEFCQIDNNCYLVTYNNATYHFTVTKNENQSLEVILPLIGGGKSEIYFVSLFKNVFRKAAYCRRCGVCAAECKFGCITMNPDSMKIDGNECKHCAQCLKIKYGCLICSSIKLPLSKGTEKMVGMDRYMTFGFRKEWLDSYFKDPDKFWDHNDLGSKMIPVFKKFLRDAGIISGKRDLTLTRTGQLLRSIGSDSEVTWAIILVNLSYTPQIGWYVRNIVPGTSYTMQDLKALLPEDIKDTVKRNIVSAYRNIMVQTPIGSQIGLGHPQKSGSNVKYLERIKWENPIPEVILYAFYRYAEENIQEDDSIRDNVNYRFTLTEILSEDPDISGLSPSQIFDIDRDTFRHILEGLSIEYSEYISTSFTHDLDNIVLSQNKTSEEILENVMVAIK